MENGTFELTTALDDCGTQLEFVNDQVVFQQMVYGYAIAGDLFLGRPTELEFTCTYNTNYGQFEQLFVQSDHQHIFQTPRVMISLLPILMQLPTDTALVLSTSMSTSTQIALMQLNLQPVTSSLLVNKSTLVFLLKIFQAVSLFLSWIALLPTQMVLIFHTTLLKTSAQTFTPEPISVEKICKKTQYS